MHRYLMWLIATIALFWVPPFFAISWLADVKEGRRRHEADPPLSSPMAWGLFGWLGALAYSARKPHPAANADLARSRSRIVAFVSILGLCAAGGAYVYQRDHPSIDVAATAAAMRHQAVSSCRTVGWMAIGGQRENVEGCYDSTGAAVGCFYREGKLVYDVTDQARAAAAAGVYDLGC